MKKVLLALFVFTIATPALANGPPTPNEIREACFKIVTGDGTIADMYVCYSQMS